VCVDYYMALVTACHVPPPSHNAAPYLPSLILMRNPVAKYKHTACIRHEPQMLLEVRGLIESRIIKFILEVINFMMLVT
jgi:hypothetical protein